MKDNHEGWRERPVAYSCDVAERLLPVLVQALEKGKMTQEAADAEAKAVEGRIKYSLDMNDLKDVDLVVEVRVGMTRGSGGLYLGLLDATT